MVHGRFEEGQVSFGILVTKDIYVYIYIYIYLYTLTLVFSYTQFPR